MSREEVIDLTGLFFRNVQRRVDDELPSIKQQPREELPGGLGLFFQTLRRGVADELPSINYLLREELADFTECFFQITECIFTRVLPPISHLSEEALLELLELFFHSVIHVVPSIKPGEELAGLTRKEIAEIRGLASQVTRGRVAHKLPLINPQNGEDVADLTKVSNAELRYQAGQRGVFPGVLSINHLSEKQPDPPPSPSSIGPQPEEEVERLTYFTYDNLGRIEDEILVTEK